MEHCAKMSLQTLDEKNKKVMFTSGAVAGLGTLALEGIGHRYFKNPTTVSKSLARAGLAAAGTVGTLQGFRYGLRRASKQSYEKLQKQKEDYIMAKTSSYFDSVGLNDFVKTASETMGNEAYLVPKKLAHEAYDLYNSLPADSRISTVLAMYDAVEPGMQKVAMKLVAANVYAEKRASIGSLTMSAAKKAIGPTATTAFVGSDIASKTKEYNAKDRSILTQGASKR